MAETPNPAGSNPAIPPSINDLIASLVAEKKRSNDIEEAKLKTATQPPAAEQSNNAAIKNEIDTARDRIKALEMESEKAARVNEELAVKLALYDKDFARTAPRRQTELSAKDALDHMRDTLGVCKAETVSMFRGIAGKSHADHAEYVKTFGNMTPIDVMIRGAIVPERGNVGMKVFAPGSDGRTTNDELLAELRDLNDGILIWRIAESAKPAGAGLDVTQCPLWRRYQVALAKFQGEMIGKALDTSDTSSFVPTGFSAELILRYDLARNVTKALRTIQVPRFPFDVPGVGAIVTVYAIAENTAAPESATAVTDVDPVDRKTSFTKHRIGARTCYSRDLEADSIIPTAVWAREELAKGIAYGEEQFIVDGDNATFHMDVDVTGPPTGNTDVRRQVLGLRAWAVDQSFTTTLSTFTTENINGMLQAMNKYAANPADLAWIGPAKVRAKMLTALNTGNFPMTVGVNNMPANTSSVNLISQYLGIEYVVMEGFRTNLNTSGFYDGTTTTKTGLLLVNKTRWAYAYDSLAPMVESISWPRTLQVEIVASIRRDFLPLDATTEHIVDYGIAI